ncbi:MAG: hypothetical protein ACT4PL_11770 [Phycisphaerales bacterium]
MADDPHMNNPEDRLEERLSAYGAGLRAAAGRPLPGGVLDEVRVAAPPSTIVAQMNRGARWRGLAVAAAIALLAMGTLVLLVARISAGGGSRAPSVPIGAMAAVPMVGQLTRLAAADGNGALDLPLSPDWRGAGISAALVDSHRVGVRFVP